MTMLDGNTAALRQYEEEQDRLESEAPTDAQVREKQEQMYWDRLHDLDAVGDALLISEMGELHLALLELAAKAVAWAHTARTPEDREAYQMKIGQFVGELLESRLYPRPEDAEYEIKNG